MNYRVLGPLAVRDGARELSLGSPRQRALLAVLVTRANEVVSSDRLADVLWDGDPPPAAANVVQGHVSDLRKALGRDAIVTRSGGYELVADPETVDLHQFERLLEKGSRALADGDAPEASERLREALALWRGRALADVADVRSLRGEVGRLEELRFLGLERRVEADLALGRHGELVGELRALVAEHPLRERPRAQLMLALYRSGRQVEALDVYRQGRQALAEEVGLEPSPPLQELERAILQHDPTLSLVEPPEPARSILVVSLAAIGLDALVLVAEPLARRPPRELILAGIVADAPELAPTSARLAERCEELAARGIIARTATFRSSAPGGDIVRLATEQDVDLVLFAGSSSSFEDPAARTVLVEAPCDVCVLVSKGEPPASRVVLVPFAGADHDWAAVEIGAWIAASRGARLRLAGREEGRQDASRLLASASLAVQRVVGVASEPLLIPSGSEGLLTAADDAALVVIGLSERWRQDGVGAVRLALAERARPPVLLVRRGLRPGGIAPKRSLTRFTWSLRPA
jgi:DNA-binding SARP family transcriptional activator